MSMQTYHPVQSGAPAKRGSVVGEILMLFVLATMAVVVFAMLRGALANMIDNLEEQIKEDVAYSEEMQKQEADVPVDTNLDDDTAGEAPVQEEQEEPEVRELDVPADTNLD